MAQEPSKRGVVSGSRASVASPLEFIASIAPESHLHRVFNHLVGIETVIKDKAGRLVWVSNNVPRWYGFANTSEMLGLHDFDLFARRLATRYWEDELRVMRSGEPLLGSLDLGFNDRRALTWYLVNKFPLRDRAGKAIGLIATMQRCPTASELPVFDSALAPVVEHILAHLCEPCPLPQLAALAGLSCRQLQRRFHNAVGMAPNEFLTRARLDEACRRLVESDDSICKIAVDLGFCDQSALTRVFHRQLAMSPKEYRHQSREGRRARDCLL